VPPEAIEAVGARLLLLPPYSPDLNPIEQFFAKLEALLRAAAPLRIGGSAWKKDPLCGVRPWGGRLQAAVLTVWRAC